MKDMYLSRKVSSVEVLFADPNVIVTPPDKDIVLPSEDVCFNLDTRELDKLIRSYLSTS